MITSGIKQIHFHTESLGFCGLRLEPGNLNHGIYRFERLGSRERIQV